VELAEKIKKKEEEKERREREQLELDKKLYKRLKEKFG